MSSATAYPDPESSHLDAGNALYVAGRRPSPNASGNNSTHTEQSHAISGASEGQHVSPKYDSAEVQDMQQQLQHHVYSQDTSSHLMAQEAMHELQNHPANNYIAPPHDGVMSRKRSKVSRACDECRRKKVRFRNRTYPIQMADLRRSVAMPRVLV
jgi:hypothetical protein